ncbi:PLC-like phosphodiesterase [Coniophora puteana RWD-64-598 SS2]|uniref:PLC-like phosphodiesterase n=1 Tax=Coniophora puteana (strain RWD-64-598) TaxID=741705 RepID=A0A5M3N248_CONPW|nr:PLC-like phosphodiesterase [Coniophora puteana RWD-64-598 SS2]EIW85462.1 PLC-like phosphodiesterase [Coniophora puteana RWD-64-598 SS2]
MAFYGWPISQCQNSYETLESQFNSGIRVIDVRLSIKNNELMFYHGIQSEHGRFSVMLNTIHAFLTNPSTCRETLVVSIKEEDNNPTLFSQLVLQEITNSTGGLDMWHLDERIPTLGEVRGKAVMFSRFGNGTGWANGLMGIHPTTWPDSDKSGFSWNCGDTLVRTADWFVYNIISLYSIPEKVKGCTDLLYPPLDTPSPALNIVFFSASSFPLALPPSVARGLGWPRWHLGFEGVNHRVSDWLLGLLGGEDEDEDQGEGEDSLADADLDNEKTEKFTESQPRIRGWAMLDFFNEPVNPGLIQMFIECNFRGRTSGEEGWP